MSASGVNSSSIGEKIERIREIKGMKQETLASLLGVSQQTVSRYEQATEIEEEKLLQIATALGVLPETIKNFNEDALFNQISNNTFNDSSTMNAGNKNCTFNPLDKVVELYERVIIEKEETIRLKDQIIEMYKENQKK